MQDKLFIFVDGQQVGSTTDTTTVSTQNNDNISIGNGGSSYIQHDFTGSIDEVRIYNRALSPAEVQALYQWAPGPVGW